MLKDVPYFSKYEASDEGFIQSKRTGQILNNSIHSDGTGVPVVSLVDDSGKIHTVETRFVIACTFLGVDFWAKPKPKLEYIDGNKMNNAVSNIRIKDSNGLVDEEWRPVLEWEDYYEVSNLGRVRRKYRNESYIRSDTGGLVERVVAQQLLKPTLNSSNDYLSVNLYHKGRSSYPTVHRLVAQAFVSNPDNLPQVNHIDRNKLNNRADNLEWCTVQHNIQHAIQTGLRKPRKKLDSTAKKLLCKETGQIYSNCKEAAKALGLSYSYLMDCIHDNRACHGMHFEQVVEDRRVKCLDTQEIFNCLTEAEEKFNFNIGDSIKRRTCIHGWTFCYMRDLPEDEEAYLWECRNRYSKWPRAEKRWEDNFNELSK